MPQAENLKVDHMAIGLGMRTAWLHVFWGELLYVEIGTYQFRGRV
jgi:hypothetical protein